MARSTPAQKPRGPASRISEMVDLMRAPASPEIVRHSGYGPMTFPAAVRPGRVPVGVVLQAVAAVDREEREARGDLLHPSTLSERTAKHERAPWRRTHRSRENRQDPAR